MEANRVTIASLIVSVGAVLCVEAAAGAVAVRIPLNPMILLGMIRVLEIALLVLTAIICGNGLASVGLARSSAFHGFARGLLWSAGFGMSALVVHLILYAIGINGMTLIRTRLPKSSGTIGLLFLIGAVLGPAAEELFFRGILYGFFRRWGVFVALTMSTLVFVIAHPGFPLIPVTQVVGGIVFAMAYEIEGSLMAPLTIHVLGNAAIFVLSWVV